MSSRASYAASLLALSRRGFVLGVAALPAACSKLITPDYPPAEKCQGQGCAMVDVHCHVFSASDLNVAGFISHIVPLPRKWTKAITVALHQELDRLAMSAKDELKELNERIAREQMVHAKTPPNLSKGLEQLAQQLGSALFLDGARSTGRLLETLRLITLRRSEIAAAMVRVYKPIELFTPAMVDYSYWSDDDSESPLADQIAIQAALSRASMKQLIERPEARIHPFAPFNPLREVREVIQTSPHYAPLGSWKMGSTRYACDAPILDTMPEAGEGSLTPLRYAIETLGFVGAKVYPPTGFLPIGNSDWSHHSEDTGIGKHLDHALHALYAYCEAEGVPLMTHGNNSNGYDLGYGQLTAPKHWAKVLAQYPRLRLNIGHFGELEGDDGRRGIEACELWMRAIADLMESYPNVYADTGCSLVPVEQPFQDRYLKLLEDVYREYPKSRQRLMYGSDYWLNTLYANSRTFVDAFSQIFRQRFPATYDDFFGNNALRFLGLLDDAGQKPDTPSRRRLTSWYTRNGAVAPVWL